MNMPGSEHKPNGSLSPAAKALALAAEYGIPDDPNESPKPEPEMSFFPHDGGRYEVSAAGVHWMKDDKSKRVCDELRVEAKTRDGASGNWGRALWWRDADGVPHRWSMPMALLQGDAADVARELASGGLHIAPGMNRRLVEYLQACPTEATLTCVAQTGWHGGVYCTSGEAIGNADRVCFQGAAADAGGAERKAGVRHFLRLCGAAALPGRGGGWRLSLRRSFFLG